MDTKALRINNLSCGYEDNNVLKNLNLDISNGTFTAIAGPNGSGKSTLLKVLIKELKAKYDDIQIFNQSIDSFSRKELARQVGFVGQNAVKDYEFTVREITGLGRYCYSDKETSKDETDSALKAVGIEHLADKPITNISGGELQLTMLARAVCQNTRILLLDEPQNNLDPYHQVLIMKLLSQMVKRGKTVICVMHDLNSIIQWCDNVILLKDGKVFDFGKTSGVLTKENIKAVYNVDCTFVSPGSDQHPLITYCNL